MSAHAYTRRQEKLLETVARQGLEGLLVTNLTNIHYLSGFTGSAATCLLLPKENHFFTDGRYQDQSRQEVQGFTIHVDSAPHVEQAKKLGIVPREAKIGVEGDFVSVNLFQQLKELFPTVTWEPTTRLVEEIAAVKEPSELELIREAVAVTDRVYEEILPLIKVGVTEKDIANRLSMLYREYADGDAYPPIVAGGPNGALPHAVPTDRPFQEGDFIVIDAAARLDGYHADMTRTPLVGKPTDRHRELYDVVKAAQEVGCKTVRAGRTCKEVDTAVRDYIQDQGYGKYFSHSTGHGLGLEIHTMPRLSQQSKDVLKENYVVTIEPGIYDPQWGGIRIEDDVIVTGEGCEILNRTTKELVSVG